MKFEFFAVAGLAGFAALGGLVIATTPQASAAQLVPALTVLAAPSQIVHVDYSERCERVHAFCSGRWPGHGVNWRRCVRIRNCRL